MNSTTTPRSAIFQFAAILLPAAFVFTSAHAAPINVTNFSFEANENTDSLGRFSFGERADFGGQLTGWTSKSGAATTVAVGWANITDTELDPSPQVGSQESQALSLTSSGSVLNTTSTAWSNLLAGDTLTLTISLGMRTTALNWNEGTFFGLTDDSADFTTIDLADTVANSGIIADNPATGTQFGDGTFVDVSFSYVVQASDLTRTGNIGILIYSVGTGATGAANQSFFDHVRLEWTFIDTDNDNLPDGYENSLIGISPAGDVSVTGLTSLSGLGGADFDGDGITDFDEYLGSDGIPNSGDESRPDKFDSDNDGLIDSVELAGSANIWTGTTVGSAPGDPTNPGNPDSDDDGILDGEEIIAGSDGFVTNPAAEDSDGDGMNDGYEVLNNLLGGLDPTDPDDAEEDLDGDSLTNIEEADGFELRPVTRADKADTDDDGYDDFSETNVGSWFSESDTGSNPALGDTDGDGLLDGQENPDIGTVSAAPYHSDPNRRDTDFDGYSDSNEVLVSFTDPASSASNPGTPIILNGDAVKNFPTTLAAGIVRRFTNEDAGKTFRLAATASSSAYPAGLGTDGWIGAVFNPNVGSGTGVATGNDNGMGFLARSPNFINPHQVFDTSAAAVSPIQGTGGFAESQDAGTGDVSFDFVFTLSPDYDTTGEVSFTLTITDEGPNSPYSTSGTFLSNNGAGGDLDLYLETLSGTVGASDFAATLSEVTAGANLKIDSVAFDGANFTINFIGEPNTTYDIASDPDLSSGFATVETTATTDGSGNGSKTFAVGANRFFRVQSQ